MNDSQSDAAGTSPAAQENSAAILPTARPHRSGIAMVLFAWLVSLFFLVIGLGAVFQTGWSVVAGVIALSIGLILLPPLNRVLRARSSGRFSRGVTGVTAGGLTLGFLVVTGIATRNAESEARRLLAEEHRADSLRQHAEDQFIAQHPFVDRELYRTWLTQAKDSARDARYTLAAFLDTARRVHAETLARQKADSLAAIAEERRLIAEEKKRVRDSIAEARRIARAIEAANAPEYYNGHEVFTGPRGGKYYINRNGKKTYIDR